MDLKATSNRSNRTSTASTFKPVDAQPIPADFNDPNHPHYPGDLEVQAPTHQQSKWAICMTKKVLWIILFVILCIIIFIIALFAGMKWGGIQYPKPSDPLTAAPANATNSATSSVDADIVTMTVITTTTTMQSTHVVPLPTTITHWITPITHQVTVTPTVPFEAPLRPISDTASAATPKSQEPKPPPAASSSEPPNDGSNQTPCTIDGHFQSDTDCLAQCKSEDTKWKGCRFLGDWRCVSCDKAAVDLGPNAPGPGWRVPS